MAANNRKDLTGKVINYWRILNYSHTKGKIAYYNCICLKCGKDFIVDGRNIRSGRSKCCVNCARERTVKANRGKVRSKYDSKTAAERSLYSDYKKGAKKRKIKFSLSFEEFKELIYKDCSYCEIEPITKRNPLKGTGRSKEREEEGWITYNGIDRINSSIEYTKSNVVTACQHCNYAKKSMSVEEFKNWIKRAFNHLIKEKE